MCKHKRTMTELMTNGYSYLELMNSRAKRYGRWCKVTIYDPLHRPSDFIVEILEKNGLKVDVTDEQFDDCPSGNEDSSKGTD